MKTIVNRAMENTKYKELLHQSRSWNGFKREAAIAELENYPSEQTIKALIERANDWVPEVRRRAQSTLIKLCKEKTRPYFINQLDNLYHLNQCSRENHSAFISEIENILMSSKDHKLVQLQLCKSNSALHYAKLLKKNFDLLILAKACLAHSNLSLRLYAITLAGKLEDQQQKEALLLRCISDKYGLVRRNSLRLILRLNLDKSFNICLQLLYDKEKSVRSQAVLYLKNKDFNCQQEFEKQLNSESLHQQRVAIWGLTEIFSKGSIDLILPFLESEYPSLRALALKACFVLSKEAILEKVFTKILFDTSPRVLKECSRLYKKCNAVIKEESFIAAIKNQRKEKNYRFIINMTKKMNKWDQLILLSKLSKINNQFLDDEIEGAFKRWLFKVNQFFMDPTKRQVTQINALDKHEKKNWNIQLKNVVKQRICLT